MSMRGKSMLMIAGLLAMTGGGLPMVNQPDPERTKPRDNKYCSRPECDKLIYSGSSAYCSAQCCKLDKARLRVLNLEREKALKVKTKCKK